MGDDGAAPCPPSIALIELAALGRFVLALSFPRLHAWLKSRGVAVQWLRFALPPAVQHVRGEAGLALGEDDLLALGQALHRRPATHVLLSGPVAERVVEVVRATCPAAAVGVVGDGPMGGTDPGGLTTVAAESRALARWLRLVAAEPTESAMGAGDDDVVPDFGFTPANPAARAMPPLGFVLVGSECLHHRSVVGNPAYDGVDLAGCRTTGCAFCVSGGSAPKRVEAVAARVLTQVDAFLATYPLGERTQRPRVRLSGQQIFREVAAVAAALRDGPRPGLDLLLDARADHILDREADLGRAAEILAGSDHRVHVCLVGIESFSRAELERMNKGVRAWQNLAAIRVLRTLERRHPATFGFREHGGLSTVLYTPWTTLDDLGLNLAVARHCRHEPLLGKLLQSRLRLYEGLPMTALARRDGLIVPSYDDPALNTARRNFYPDEIPWRFRDPRLEPINRLTTRMTPDPALAGDPLYHRIQGWSARRSKLALAAMLVERSLGVSRPLSVDELLAEPVAPGADAAPERNAEAGTWRRAARDRALAGAPAAADIIAPVTGAEGGAAAVGDLVEPLLALQQAGISRANRLEALSPATAAAVAELVRGELRAVQVVELRGCRGGGLSCDVFFGPRLEDVQEAMRLTDVEHAGTARADVAHARRGIGALYGYPSCCAESFARTVCARSTNHEWLILQRRCALPGPISPLLNPFGGLGLQYVPCSFACAASLRRAQRLAETIAARSARAGPVATHADAPALFLLDRPGNSIQLLPRGPVGREFEFIAAGRVGDDPRVAALEPGGRIHLDEGIVFVERTGARVASFHLAAAVFWPTAAFDPEFWREVAREALESVADADEPPATAVSGRAPAPRAAVHPHVARLAARLARVLLRGEAAVFAGFVVASIRPTHGRSVTVTLAPPDRGDEPLELQIEPLRGAVSFHRTARSLAVSCSPRTPLRSRARQEALAALARFLTRTPP